MDQIQPTGPVPARIMLIGESPGETEIKEGKPFVGMAGRVLDGLLRDAGIKRDECYITNIIMWRPDGNDFGRLYEDSGRTRPKPELTGAIQSLLDECNGVSPTIIVGLGDEPLRALTGYRGITKWRGSVLTAKTGHKFIATIHPAAISREWKYRPAALADFQRALREAQYPEIRTTKRTYFLPGFTDIGGAPALRVGTASGGSIPQGNPGGASRGTSTGSAGNFGAGPGPNGSALEDLSAGIGETTSDARASTAEGPRGSAESNAGNVQPNTDTRLAVDVIEWVTRLRQEAKYVAFDIETSYRDEAPEIKSIAFACDTRPNWAICIPFCFEGNRYWSQEDDIAIWEAVEGLLTDERVGKIAHNGSYDIEFIDRTVGFRTRGFVFDTMLAAHALYLELPKGLDFWTSVMTDHPYYKDMIDTKDPAEFFKYNAIDACVTMEIATKLMAQLKKDNLWDFYHNYIHALWEPLMEMQIQGVKFDYLKRNSVRKRFQEEIAVLQKRLDTAVGHALNVNSPKQMKEWLYKELALKEKTKKRKATGETTVAADDEALQELYEETKNEAIQTVIKIREKSKILGTYLDVKLDEDKRIRCGYLITGTETGRLSSRATARGTGTNLQNIPPGVIRTLFVPDDGKVFINADLSQAEARVVAYLANESRLINVFAQGGDIHRKNAANIFGVTEADVTDNQRQLAKRVVHASNYGMGPLTFAKTAGIPAADAKRLLNQYFATYPGIANWQNALKAEVQKKRYLITPLGRKRIFYNQWAESLYKEGLAYIPQSTVADIVNQGLVELWRRRGEVEGLDILLQVHDSILIQVPKEALQKGKELIKACLTRPIEINGKVLIIPVDLKFGENWEDLKKDA